MAKTSKRLDRAELAKRVERAEKLLQKGKPAEALGEYHLVLRDDPENDGIRQVTADLSLSLGRTPEAVRLLGELFERQITAGDATRASLTYKKLARHGNPTCEQKIRFGQLLEGSNRKMAVTTYEAAEAELLKLDRKQEAAEVLSRIVALEPTEANLLRVAELASELGNSKVSALAFRQAAEAVAAAGGDASPWYERAYREDASDPAIALAYAKSLLAAGQAGAAIFILEPQLNSKEATLELREACADALLAVGRCTEAEPLVWQLFQQNPSRLPQVIQLIGNLLDKGDEETALALARKLEQFQRRRGERRQFVSGLEGMVAAHRNSLPMLEFLAELYNASNREGDYCQAMLGLFDLYCSRGEFVRAGECLDRAAEVDPYEPGHLTRLDQLKGKIDDTRFRSISGRFNNPGNATAEEPARAQTLEQSLGAGTLQDLMLQAEILVQYGMRNKAVEKLQRIQELFPREEERNPELQQLYVSAGLAPRYAESAPSPASPTAPAARAMPEVAAAEAWSFARVAEISRKLYQQGTAAKVLSAAVSEIGAHWEVTRCVAVTGKAGLTPTATADFWIGEKKDDAAGIGEIVVCLQQGMKGPEPVEIPDALKATTLESAQEAARAAGVVSILAIPLHDGDETVGLLALMCGQKRAWPEADRLVLRTLADQMVIALNNAGLRRLVSNLSVTDEKSGLLKRASYLDLVLAEAKRAVQNNSPVSILLMQFGKSPAMIRDYGESEVQAVMEKIGQLFASNIRSSDLAFLYETTTIAILLGETAEKEAMSSMEKLRKITSGVRWPAKDGAPGVPAQFSAGLAEAVIRAEYDPADIVTEVINRADHALALAVAQGPGKIIALGPAVAAGAVA
jgi:diguanylate cyclase (GGDEF)-like protein